MPDPSHASKPVLLLSNGHGEDLSGARIGQALRQQGLAVAALPLVGHGRPYQQVGIPVLGRTRECSTGGLGYTSLAGQLREIREGQWTYLLGRLFWLVRHRRQFGFVLAVGDLLPVVGLWLSGLPGASYLVAYSSHYEGQLRLPWPCPQLLRSKRILAIWSRDQLTAADLSQQLGKPVRFLGNPFMDGLTDDPPEERSQSGSQSLALLPGSRMPEALQNLALMLQVLERMPVELQQAKRLRLRVALVSALQARDLESHARRLGWQLHQQSESAVPELRRNQLQLELGWSAFGAILQEADLVLASAGTASEQAVGLGKPVLQLCGAGPQFRANFAEAQRRLLGPGVSWAPGASGAPDTLQATADLASRQLALLADPVQGPRWRRSLAGIGAERIGPAGGSVAMAVAIVALLPPPPFAS